MGAYEALWTDSKATFKSLSRRFAGHLGCVACDFVPADRAWECADIVTSGGFGHPDSNGSVPAFTAPENTAAKIQQRTAQHSFP